MTDLPSINESRQRIWEAKSNLDYILELFGDRLAEKEGYKGGGGKEAIWLYLIRTYHWTPAYVKSMNTDDIRLVLTKEMTGFKASR